MLNFERSVAGKRVVLKAVELRHGVDCEGALKKKRVTLTKRASFRHAGYRAAPKLVDCKNQPGG